MKDYLAELIRTFVNFRGLLYELGLSSHPAETTAIKIEVDTKPPHGAVLATIVASM